MNPFDSLVHRVDMLETLVRAQQQILDGLQQSPPARSAESIAASMPHRPESWPIYRDSSGGIIVAPPPPDPHWIPVYHEFTDGVRLARDDKQDRACHQPGMYLLRAFRESEIPTLEEMRTFRDGEWRAPQPTDRPVCVSCLQPIHPYSAQDLDYLAVLLPDLPPPAIPPLPKKRNRRRSSEETEAPEVGRAEDASGSLTRYSSPGRAAVPTSPPTIFPGYTQEARTDVLQDLQHIAQQLGLENPFNPRAPSP